MKLKLYTAALCVVAAGASIASAASIADSTLDGEPRLLRKEVTVQAPLDEVWHAWTTAEGLEFVSQESNVELRLGGPFELFLHLEADERGRRGAEGSRVLAFVPKQMLAFDWTFPPSLPSLRYGGAKTQAAVFFDDVGDGNVRVRFVQHGWQEGEDWDAGYAYFDQAWGFVLQRLKERLESPGDPMSADGSG